MRKQIVIIIAAVLACNVSAVFDREDVDTSGYFDIRSFPVDEQVLKSQGKCYECMYRVSFNIVSETEKAMLRKCGRTDCEYVKHVCELSLSDPAVLKGYIAGYTDAIGKAKSYCYGEGSCNAPLYIEQGLFSYIPEALVYAVYDSRQTFEELVKDDVSAVRHFKNMIAEKGSQVAAATHTDLTHAHTHTDLTDLTASIHRFPGFTPFDRNTHTSPFVPEASSVFSPYFPPSRFDDDLFALTEKQMERELFNILNRKTYNNQCYKCAANIMEKVMVKAIRFVLQVCRDNQAHPAIARKCSMIQKIPNFSLGYALAKVEPWKFSSGFCIATRDCLGDRSTNTFDVNREMLKTNTITNIDKSNKGFFRGNFIKDRFRPERRQNDMYPERRQNDMYPEGSDRLDRQRKSVMYENEDRFDMYDDSIYNVYGMPKYDRNVAARYDAQYDEIYGNSRFDENDAYRYDVFGNSRFDVYGNSKIDGNMNSRCGVYGNSRCDEYTNSRNDYIGYDPRGNSRLDGYNKYEKKRFARKYESPKTYGYEYSEEMKGRPYGDIGYNSNEQGPMIVSSG